MLLGLRPKAACSARQSGSLRWLALAEAEQIHELDAAEQREPRGFLWGGARAEEYDTCARAILPHEIDAMVEAFPFQDLIRRVRAGGGDSADDLVRQFDPTAGRAVRFRLADTRLVRSLDWMDNRQLVLGSFLVRAALG